MFGSRSLRIGQLFGIGIEIHASWLIIFVLVFISLSTGVLPQLRGATAPEFVDFLGGFIAAVLFFSSVLIHELSHSLVGRRFGIKVDRITLFIFGGLAQMTGEAENPRAEFVMAAAGPGMSFVLAAFFGLVSFLGGLIGLPGWVRNPFGWLALVNVVLGAFNLVPGFPLDGGRLFRSILWGALGDMDRATRIATRVGQGFAGLLVAAGASLLLFTTEAFNGFWFILLGFFLWSAATQSYQQLEVSEALAGVTVDSIMTSRLVTAPAHVTLADLVSDYFLRYHHGRFPVADGGRIIGTITLKEVRDVARERWTTTLAREAATPLSEDDFIDAGQPALAALVRMAQTGRGQLLVRDSSGVVGIVTRSDITSAIRVRGSLRVAA